MTDNDSEKQLFRDAVHGTTRIQSRKIAPTPANPTPRARFTRADEEAVVQESLNTTPQALELEAGDELRYARAGRPESVIRKLRRGLYRVQSEIDLHGLTVAQAKIALVEFFAECHTQDMHCVRVVHGKGKRSGHRGPVIKGKVNIWLRRRNDVIAFVSAPGNDGGTGAVYVLIDRSLG